MSATVTSFKEIPLEELNYQDEFKKLAQTERNQESFDAGDETASEKNNLKKNATYGSLNQPEVSLAKFKKVLFEINQISELWSFWKLQTKYNIQGKLETI